MCYPTFRDQGWPIGSGMVESANKLVVQARRVWGGDALAADPCQFHAGVTHDRLQPAMAGDVAEGSPTRASAKSVSARGSSEAGGSIWM